MKRFLHTLFGSQKTRGHATARPATTRPNVETLEERSCLSVSVIGPPSGGLWFGPSSGGTLSITGDANANAVWVTQDDAAGQIVVQWRDTPGSPLQPPIPFRAAGITNVSVDLGGGDDYFSYRLVSDMTQAKTISVLLGSGHDTGWFDFGLHKSHKVAADLDLTVRGQGGDDYVRADFGDVEAKRLTFLGDMSDGYDTCAVYQWGVLRGTSAHFNMSGGNQDDYLSFYNDNGSWASAGLVVGMNGDNGDDHLYLFFDDIMSGHYRFALGGGAGNDTIVADIYNRAPAATAPLGDLSVRLAGHDGNDVLSLRLQDDSGRLPILLAELDGGPGLDIVTRL
jgi:hypothetical protein